MPSSYLKIKLRVEEAFFRNFRCALADRRKNYAESSRHNVELDRTMREMQEFCGEIENSLYSARTKLSQMGVPGKNPTERS